MRTIIALAMILMAGVANAQQQDDPFQTMGPGANTCGEFAQDVRQNTDSQLIYFPWAQGYMSALNDVAAAAQQGDTVTYRNLHGWSTSDQLAYLRSYCNQHPSGNYADGVRSLFASLPTHSRPKGKA